MSRIAFVVPGAPIPKGRPRFIHRGRETIAFTPDKTAAAESYFAAIASRHRPPQPIAGPIEIELKFILPPPGGRTKFWFLPSPRKPDLDNLAKLALDAIAAAGFFAVGDQQVARLSAVKAYGLQPRTCVSIRTIAGDELIT